MMFAVFLVWLFSGFLIVMMGACEDGGLGAGLSTLMLSLLFCWMTNILFGII